VLVVALVAGCALAYSNACASPLAEDVDDPSWSDLSGYVQ